MRPATPIDFNGKTSTRRFVVASWGSMGVGRRAVARRTALFTRWDDAKPPWIIISPIFRVRCDSASRLPKPPINVTSGDSDSAQHRVTALNFSPEGRTSDLLSFVGELSQVARWNSHRAIYHAFQTAAD